MPCFRGIEVSIIAGSKAERLPEFPHPEGTAVRLSVLPFRTPGYRESLDSLERHPFIKKPTPRVAVYIPSSPGDQFWVKFHTPYPHPPFTHLFFKLRMNGRHITSWGVDTKVQLTGTVARAFYEPEDRWHAREEGSQFRRYGIEARYFYFMPEPEKLSAADDGGVIEVQVFRSKGRRRRAIKLESYRAGENYGIMSPSAGLIESPQDAIYYDWSLIDPKDAPYATFMFHYRAYKHLLQLNILPQLHLRAHPPCSALALTPQQPSTQSFLTKSSALPCLQDNICKSSPVELTHSNKNATSLESADSISSDQEKSDLDPSESPTVHRVTHFRIGQSRQADSVAREVVLPERVLRLLPSQPVSFSRKSSVPPLRFDHLSSSPSIIQYVNSAEYTEVVEVGVAKEMIIHSESSQSLRMVSSNKGDVRGDESSSRGEVSPPSSIEPRPSDLSALRSLPSASSETGGNHMAASRLPSSDNSPERVSLVPFPSSENTVRSYSSPRDWGTMKLTEAQWMMRAPSPVTHQSTNLRWSPRPDRKFNSPAVFNRGILSEKDRGIYDGDIAGIAL